MCRKWCAFPFTWRRVKWSASASASIWTIVDLTVGRCHHISMHVGSTGCPSLCAALIYPGSGFPENPQISVKHNQPPPLLHQAGGAYSVQLHKSHCNLCCVIIGFRCLPLGRQRAEQGHRSSVPGQSQIPFSVCYVFCFFLMFPFSAESTLSF